MKLKKLLVSLLLATGLTLGGWVWLTSLSGSPVMAAPAARPKLAPSPVTVTLTSSKDNTLIESPTGSFSNGAGDSFFVGRTGQGNNSIRRGVIAFDLSAIPAGSTIISASLKLNMSMTIAGSQPITLHRLLVDWGEGSSAGSGGGAPAAPGDATWLHRFYTTTVWTTPGGDFTAAPSALTQVGGDGFYQWGSSQMVSDVQDWYNNPVTNFGWLLQGNESVGGTAKRFGSRENFTPANRPALIVTYLPPPNLTLSKQVSNPSPIPGQGVSYTIVVTNSGQGPATGARISDTFPSGINFVGPVTLNPSGAGIPGNGGTLPILAHNLTITPGTKVTVSFQVSISPGLTPGTILTNTVAITSNEITVPILSRVSLKIGRPLYLPIVMKQG